MTNLEIAVLVIVAPAFVFALFRAAAIGWFHVKYKYQRRLVDGISKGECDGKSSSQ